MKRIFVTFILLIVGLIAACRQSSTVVQSGGVKNSPHFTLEQPYEMDFEIHLKAGLFEDNKVEVGHSYCGGDLSHSDEALTGRFVQGENPNKIYYIATDNKKYVASFLEYAASWLTQEPVMNYDLNSKDDALLYFCSQVIVVPNHVLGALPLGGLIPIRPGSHAVIGKPKTERGEVVRYMVDKDWTLRPVSGDLYRQYGLWMFFVPEDVLSNYKVGQPVEKLSSYDPQTFYGESGYDLNYELTGVSGIILKFAPSKKADLEGLMP